MPDHATELDGSKSHSPLGELTYYWELAEGPEGVILKYSNTSKLSVAGLEIGVYRLVPIVLLSNVTFLICIIR